MASCTVCRFSHVTVKAVLAGVANEVLANKEYDPDNSSELVKFVADQVQARLRNSWA